MSQVNTGLWSDENDPDRAKTCLLTDRFGNTLRFGNAGSFFCRPFPIDKGSDYWTHYQTIRNMEIREDDIILASFPKTGTHWHSEMLRMLVRGEAKYSDEEKEAIVLVDMKSMSQVDAMESPRLLVFHTPFRCFPRQALEKKVKIVYLDRNPKDVFVSLYNNVRALAGPARYPGTFEHFFHMMLEMGFYNGDLFNYLLEWQEGIEANPHIYTSVFEEVKLNPVAGVVKLNEYLGRGLSKEVCEEIAVACSFKKLKSEKDRSMTDEIKRMFQSEKNAFYRKGDIGDWKNWFTVAMNEDFDVEFKKRMATYKRKYTFEV